MRAAAAAVLLLALAAALPTLAYDFVWDDRIFLLGKPAYRRFDLAQLLWGLGNDVEYLPLRDLTYALDAFFWGLVPWGYHLTNVLLYAAQAALLVFVGRRVERHLCARPSLFVPPCAALLFALHPLHVEGVAFITGRNVVLSGAFLFLAVWAYLGRPPRAGAAWGAFLAALLAKATSLFLPLWLCAHEALWGTGRRAWRRLLPFLLLGVGAGVFFHHVAATTGIVDPGRTATFGSLSPGSRLAVAGQIPFFYLAKFVFPVGLAPEYPETFPATWRSPGVWLAWTGLLGLSLALFLLRRQVPRLFWGWVWYLAALLPVSNLFATTPVVADRYAYLPLYGLAYAAAALLAGLPGKVRGGLTAVVALVLLSLTWQQNTLWRNEETLWRGTLARHPGARKARYNLAAYWLAAGRQAEAWRLLKELEAETGDVGSRAYFQALAAYRRGRYAAAVETLTPVVTGGGGSLSMLALLGRAYEALGKPQAALQSYLRAVLLDGLDDEGVLPLVRQRLSRLQAALRARWAPLEAHVRAHPRDRNARARLAVGLEELGLFQEALAHYRVLEKQGGGNWALYYNLGNVCRKLRRYGEAVAYYRQALRHRPEDARTWNNLGVALKGEGQYEEAAAAFRRALALAPDFGKALFNLAALAFRRGERDEAARLFREVAARFPQYRARARFYLGRLPP